MEVKTKFDIGDVAFVKLNNEYLPCEVVNVSFCKYYSITGAVTHISYNVFCNNKIQTFNEEQLLTDKEKGL